uniref:Uncharacterized protein n=1 Tax=Cucumis melo TaxID=3656 RepID=A0A9I9EJJ6_CUCME
MGWVENVSQPNPITPLMSEIGIFPTLKNVGDSEKYVGKGSPDAVLGIETNVGGSCVGHASGKPLSTPSLSMQSTTSEKPRLLFRCHVLRWESLTR